MISTARLIDAALILRGEAPEAWDQFVMAMREYSAAAATEMVRCDPAMLQRAQGMAITANDIAMTLHNAPKIKERTLNVGQPQPEHRRHGF
jgi:hypothetical protein